MNIIPLFVILPLGAAVLILVVGRLVKKAGPTIAVLFSLALVALSLTLFFSGPRPMVYKMGGWGTIAGIPVGIYLVIDGLSVLMLVLVNLIVFLITLYSLDYIMRYTGENRFYALFLLLLTGMNGVVLSGDMFNIFVFMEIAAISSYALVAFGTEADELEAAFKYQVMGTVASALILLGIIFLYRSTGTLNMADMGRVIRGADFTRVGLFAAALFLVGFGLKSAIMPFHAWLPDAHPSAPAPVSAVLSGLLIKVIGIYALGRILFNIIGVGKIPGILSLFLILGTISMIAGALLALGQKDFKRLLAYSSISQIGFVVFALGLGTPLGYLGAIFHLLNHAVFKSLLFLNSGAVVYASGTRDLDEMGGLTRRMPITGTTSLIASLSIAGIPPFNGFWSKLIIIMAAVQSGHLLLAIVAILVSVITLAYYLKVQRLAFFGRPREKLKSVLESVREVPFWMSLAMIVLAVLCLAMAFLCLPSIRGKVLTPAVRVLENGVRYSSSVLKS